MEYLVSNWVLDSDGTPHVTLHSYKTYESALNKFNIEKNIIIEKSKQYQHTLIKINSDVDYDNYSDNIDEYKFYVVDESYDNVIAYYQDSGWKRPIGVSLQTINKNENDDLNYSTNLKCYPICHGGQW